MFKLCLPSILYFISYIFFTIWSIFYFKKYPLYDFILDFITIIFVTWLLNYLCNSNLKSVSWILFYISITISILVTYYIKKFNISSSDVYG
jgi:hypothetical protein